MFSTLPKQLKLVRTQQKPVSGVHDKEQHHSNKADVMLDSGLNLFNIIANLYSKLYYEVLLKSGNHIVNLWKQILMDRT